MAKVTLWFLENSALKRVTDAQPLLQLCYNYE
jgi:hypothetical protein